MLRNHSCGAWHAFVHDHVSPDRAWNESYNDSYESYNDSYPVRTRFLLVYLVKWKGYSYEESTWEPKSNFKSHTLKAYHDQRKAERAQESDSSSDDDDDLHGGQTKA